MVIDMCIEVIDGIGVMCGIVLFDFGVIVIEIND